MKSKSAKLLDLVLWFGICRDRAVVMQDGGNTISLFGACLCEHVPPCLAVSRIDKHRSAFSWGDDDVLMAPDAVVIGSNGKVFDLYYLE